MINLQEKILSQLTEEEMNSVIWPEGPFDGMVYAPDMDTEIPFCEKCLTRIKETDGMFCFNFVYLCSNCREV